MNPDKKKNIELANDDVEELIKAAEDAVLLKLNANAHTVYGISSDLLSGASLRTSVHQNMKPKKKNKNPEMVNDEVEELLRASEDAVLLKLNANSHTVHGSASDLHPDLHGRFQALKSGSKNTKKSDLLTKRAPTAPPPPPQEDDLYSRFAALKDTLPKPSCNFLGNASNLPPGVDNIDDDDEDEVEKVIRWAKDSARLDPSPPSDEDDDTKDDDISGDSEVSDEDENEDEDDDPPKKDQKTRKK